MKPIIRDGLPDVRSRKITNACSCDTCQSMCKTPCWPTPAEAKRLIDAGYGPRLRCDYWVGGGPGGADVLVLSGALDERLGDIKPGWPTEDGLECNFKVNGLCELHDKGLKPWEGRIAHHGRNGKGDREKIVAMWNNTEAQKLASDWIAEHGRKHEPQDARGKLMSAFDFFRQAFAGDES